MDADADYFATRLPTQYIDSISMIFESAPVIRGSSWRRKNFYKTAECQLFSSPVRVFVSYEERSALVAVANSVLRRSFRISGCQELMFSHAITLAATDAVRWLKVANISTVVIECYAMKASIEEYLLYISTALPSMTTAVMDISRTLRPWSSEYDRVPAFELFVTDRFGTSQTATMCGPDEYPGRLWRKEVTIPNLGVIQSFPCYAVVGNFCLGGHTVEIRVRHNMVLGV
jgi:hypothetical protein